MKNRILNIYELKTNFSRYLRQVMAGRSITIAVRNKPVAKIVALEGTPPSSGLTFGALKGEFTVPKDFDAPLAEFERDIYGDG